MKKATAERLAALCLTAPTRYVRHGSKTPQQHAWAKRKFAMRDSQHLISASRCGLGIGCRYVVFQRNQLDGLHSLMTYPLDFISSLIVLGFSTQSVESIICPISTP